MSPRRPDAASKSLVEYAQAAPRRALLDLATSLVPYLALSWLMYLSLSVPTC
jgi:hypothetical protein